MVSASKQKYMKCFVAFHLGVLKNQFESRELDENLIENVDETHFIINYDNGKTLGLKGNEHVKCMRMLWKEIMTSEVKTMDSKVDCSGPAICWRSLPYAMELRRAFSALTLMLLPRLLLAVVAREDWLLIVLCTNLAMLVSLYK
jgi:hypothetical protein